MVSALYVQPVWTVDAIHTFPYTQILPDWLLPLNSLIDNKYILTNKKTNLLLAMKLSQTMYQTHI